MCLTLFRAAYYEGALMLSEEAHLLTGTLLGLNAIDVSFDLKGENVDVGGLPVIDYTPFLRFQQWLVNLLDLLKTMLFVHNRQHFEIFAKLCL
jgi:hypothetical protein